jgi:hypothetical protein
MVITTAVITLLNKIGLVVLPLATFNHFCISGSVMGSPFVVWVFIGAHVTDMSGLSM